MARKDAERVFGVLKGRWGILNRPLRPHTIDRIGKLVYACVMLHNMILHEAGTTISPVYIRDPLIQPVFDEAALAEIRHEETHFCLRFDLMENIHAQQLPYLEVDDEDAKVYFFIIMKFSILVLCNIILCFLVILCNVFFFFLILMEF
jgi:hypothetical protein